MAKSEQELLKDAIDQIRKYDEDKRSPYSMEIFMLKLNDADQSKNADLWSELRIALAESEEVRREATRKFLTRTYFAEEGYWWWDPANWEHPEDQG